MLKPWFQGEKKFDIKTLGNTLNPKQLISDYNLLILMSALVSWREFGCRDDANAWRKSTKEADKHKNFLLQFRK